MTSFTASTSISTGKNKLNWNVRFVSLPHAMLTHGTFSDLTGGATKLLLSIVSSYVGNNNGHLTATHSLMKRFGFSSKESLSRGIRELIHCGYIIRTRSQHLRSPALYAVTWLPINAPPAGTPYDPRVGESREALDLWRYVGPITIGAAA